MNPAIDSNVYVVSTATIKMVPARVVKHAVIESSGADNEMYVLALMHLDSKDGKPKVSDATFKVTSRDEISVTFHNGWMMYVSEEEARSALSRAAYKRVSKMVSNANELIASFAKRTEV